MFLKADAKVLELRHPVDEMVNDCYAELATAAGLRCAHLPCDLAPSATEDGLDINFADLMVDVDHLEARLEHWTSDAEL